MLDTVAVEDIELYLKDEGLDDNQIESFFDSHDLYQLDEEEAWEVVQSHILRDDDND